MIKIGDSKIGAVRFGGAPISKIYKGSDLVFQNNSGPSGGSGVWKIVG